MVTTYLTFRPAPHENKELQRLVNELAWRTGVKWYARRVFSNVKFGIFVKYKTELLRDIGGGEFQIIQCVTTEKEAEAYIYGALGHIV